MTKYDRILPPTRTASDTMSPGECERDVAFVSFLQPPLSPMPFDTAILASLCFLRY